MCIKDVPCYCLRLSSIFHNSLGQNGAHLGPVGPRWAPCWPHEPCYQGCYSSTTLILDRHYQATERRDIVHTRHKVFNMMTIMAVKMPYFIPFWQKWMGFQTMASKEGVNYIWGGVIFANVDDFKIRFMDLFWNACATTSSIVRCILYWGIYSMMQSSYLTLVELNIVNMIRCDRLRFTVYLILSSRMILCFIRTTKFYFWSWLRRTVFVDTQWSHHYLN